MYTRQKKKHTTYNCSTPRKITSDRPVLLILMQRYVRKCGITHLLQSGFKTEIKKIGYEPSGGQIVKSQKKAFYNALLLD